MYTTVQFFDLIKAKHNLPSDYALGKHLGVTHSSISKHRHAKYGFDSKMAFAIANSLDLDPAYVLLCGIVASAKSTDEKSALTRLLVFAELNPRQLAYGRGQGERF